VALGAGALVPAVGVIVQLITRRRLDGVGGVVVVSVLATIALSLLTDNPRFLLAREGFITAMWGVWFLATLRARRPAAFRLARPLMEGRRSFGQASWDELWATEPAFGGTNCGPPNRRSAGSGGSARSCGASACWWTPQPEC
jgi:hypothetical protein